MFFELRVVIENKARKLSSDRVLQQQFPAAFKPCETVFALDNAVQPL
jgi:hypothetical protein